MGHRLYYYFTCFRPMSEEFNDWLYFKKRDHEKHNVTLMTGLESNRRTVSCRNMHFRQKR